MARALSQPAQPQRELESQFEQIALRRSDLEETGLLSSEIGPVPLALDQVTLRREDVRRFMSLYLADTSEKLAELDDVSKRLQLFETLIRNYFTDKTVKLSRSGVRIITSTEDDLSAEMLSSGEQHILVLFFRLLFGQLGKNHLVMIDEPELSLHARWQIRFVHDLMTIRSITLTDFLLASHSPLIFQGHWELARDLIS
jgi:predicted ATPase